MSFTDEGSVTYEQYNLIGKLSGFHTSRSPLTFNRLSTISVHGLSVGEQRPVLLSFQQRPLSKSIGKEKHHLILYSISYLRIILHASYELIRPALLLY